MCVSFAWCVDDLNILLTCISSTPHGAATARSWSQCTERSTGSCATRQSGWERLMPPATLRWLSTSRSGAFPPSSCESVCVLWVQVWVYHWRELPQVSFVSWQKFCHDKCVCHGKTCLLLWQKYACHDKTLFRQNNFVATKVLLWLSQTNICHDKNLLQWTHAWDKHNFVATKLLLQQEYFCVCHDKTFVMTKMILVAAPANIWYGCGFVTVIMRKSSAPLLWCGPARSDQGLSHRQVASLSAGCGCGCRSGC